jgi:hypothetical protein
VIASGACLSDIEAREKGGKQKHQQLTLRCQRGNPDARGSYRHPKNSQGAEVVESKAD